MQSQVQINAQFQRSNANSILHLHVVGDQPRVTKTEKLRVKISSTVNRVKDDDIAGDHNNQSMDSVDDNRIKVSESVHLSKCADLSPIEYAEERRKF